MGAISSMSGSLRSLLDLPLPLARQAARLSESSEAFLSNAVLFCEATLRWTALLGVAELLKNSTNWNTAAPDLLQLLKKPGFGAWMTCVRSLEKRSPECTGWALHAPFKEGAPLIELFRPRGSRGLTIGRFWDFLVELRNAIMHGRVGSVGLMPTVVRSLGEALLPLVQANPLLQSDWLCPEVTELRDGVDDSYFVARSIRGPVVHFFADGRRQPLSHPAFESRRLYMVRGSRSLSLYPWILLHGEDVLVLDGLARSGPLYVSQDGRADTPAGLRTVFDREVLSANAVFAGDDEPSPRVSTPSGERPSDPRLGGFELQERIASGYQCDIFRATSVRDGRDEPVLLKVLRPEHRHDSWHRETLEREARLGILVHHPNVVRVEQFAVIAGVPVLVREFVDGVSLHRVRRALLAARNSGFDGVPRLVSIALGVLWGLAAAHGAVEYDGQPAGVIHGSLSHHDVLLSTDGVVKLHSLATLGARAGQPPGQGRLAGRIADGSYYFSPELKQGQSIDERTDVFHVGVILWELLTLRSALPHPQALSVERLDKYAPMAGPDLSTVVSRALAADRRARFPSVAAFARSLADACPAARQVSDADRRALAEFARTADSERRRNP